MRRRTHTWFLNWCAEAKLTPHPHQLSGLQWAIAIENGLGSSQLRTGGILADEMGLGKTMTALAIMMCNPKHHQLIVVPRVLLAQWRDIIRERLHHDPLVMHGPKVHRRTAEDIAAAPIVLTTYGMITRRSRPTATHLLLSEQPWGRVFFDEAHHLRNRKTNFIGARALTAEHTWLLTGTPIQNSRMDLIAYWSLLGVPKTVFVFPGAEKQLIANHVLRRTKASLGLDMAEPETTVTNCQWQYHEEQDIGDQFHSTLKCLGRDRSEPVRHGVQVFGAQTLAAMVRCRQSCVTADLYLDELRDWEKRMRSPNATQEPLPIIDAGSKLQDVRNHILAQRAIETTASEPHRNRLVFCHYLGAIEYLRATLEADGLKVGEISGKTPVGVRQGLAKNPVDVLILQIRTGCEGLNLQAYSDVYLVTPHWNPAVEEQAIGRCHRMGQERGVRVFRFVMGGTGEGGMSLDEYCSRTQDKKRKAAELIPIKCQ